MVRPFSVNAQKLLLIEDEPGLVMTLTDLLSGEGYDVKPVQNGKEGLLLASTVEFDLIVLDVMLPGMSGFDVCRDLRKRGIRTPILMLTARGELEDKVKGLHLGADDYLAKPFAIPEFLARLQALLRRASSPEAARTPKTYQFGSVVVDVRSTTVRRDGKIVEMSAREFELLCYLIENRGATISRRQLLKEVWGYDFAMLTRTVDVHFGLLRQKLEADPKNPRHFLTVRGLGYKFVSEDP
ncbi:MAG TPA: response regulator transcription factor [Terriglobia bacterium]|nr:response regulator transcription factor [Terriglobia bacterium]